MVKKIPWELVAMLLTDGWVSQANGTWEIGFANKSEKFRELFKKIVRENFKIKKFKERKTKAGIPTVSFFSKEIGDNLRSLVNTFRTKPCESWPACPLIKMKNININRPLPCVICKQTEAKGIKFPTIMLKADDIPFSKIRKFLRIVFTADGFVSIITRKSGRIQCEVGLKCFNPTLKLLFSSLLNVLNIPHTIDEEGIKIRKKKALIEFWKKIGFINDVKIGKDSRKFTGIPKQILLNFGIQRLLVRQAGAKPSQWAYARRGDPECPSSAGAVAL